MIYSVSGKLVYKDETMAVIDNNGLGLEMYISRTTFHNLPEPGNEARLFTKMIVRDDDIFLIGFLSIDERRLYESLLTVSGIGPKQGLKILSDLTPSEIRNAIISGNEGILSKVKGIGGKTASRIILELKDKIKKLQISDMPSAVSHVDKKRMEILLAMRVLGYNDNESKRVIESAFANKEGLIDKDVEDIIKFILSGLAR